MDKMNNNAGRYVSVNGLEMYYESHGMGQPLVLLHGAFSAIGTSFGALLPSLATTRQVIAFELQAHGHTADIDRPLSTLQMAEDTAAALQKLGIPGADVLGYSMGARVALELALNHPVQVRKLVLVSGAFQASGLHPGLMEGLGNMKPEQMFGSPFHEEYLRIAPRPEDFARLFAKKTQMDQHTPDIPVETFRALKPPALLIIADSDIIHPEHAVDMFRLLGGGVIGDLAGLPKSPLAIIPGATHISIASRDEVLVPMITSFLDAPMPSTGE